MKVLISTCHGGFGFSDKFVEHIKELRGEYELNDWDLERDDQEVIEEAIKFGLKNAEGMFASFRIEEVADGLSYYIDDYDGKESIILTLLVTTDELSNGLSPEQIELAELAHSIHIKRS
jgi:hypothetical protein